MSAITALAAGVTLARPDSWFTSSYPSKAVPTLKWLVARDPDVKVFADVQYADWLVWPNPKLFSGRVAYDTSLELLTPMQLAQIADPVAGPKGRGGLLAPYGVWVLYPINKQSNHRAAEASRRTRGNAHKKGDHRHASRRDPGCVSRESRMNAPAVMSRSPRVRRDRLGIALQQVLFGTRSDRYDGGVARFRVQGSRFAVDFRSAYFPAAVRLLHGGSPYAVTHDEISRGTHSSTRRSRPSPSGRLLYQQTRRPIPLYGHLHRLRARHPAGAERP